MRPSLLRPSSLSSRLILSSGLLSIVLLAAAGFLLASIFTVSALFVTHYAIVQPFVVLLAALAADIILKSARQRSRRERAGGRLFVRILPTVRAQTELALTGIGAGEAEGLMRLLARMAENLRDES